MVFSTTLTADLGAADLIVSVVDNTGASTTYPWKAMILTDGVNAREIVTVTGGVAEGLDWDIRRGQDGTDPLPHLTGAVIRAYLGTLADAIAADNVVDQPGNPGSIVVKNLAGDITASLYLNSNGEIILEGAETAGNGTGLGSVRVDADGASHMATGSNVITIEADGTITIQPDGRAGIVLDPDGTITMGEGGLLTLTDTFDVLFGSPNSFSITGMPTADPAVAGALWVDTAAGFVVKVSQG